MWIIFCNNTSYLLENADLYIKYETTMLLGFSGTCRTAFYYFQSNKNNKQDRTERNIMFSTNKMDLNVIDLLMFVVGITYSKLTEIVVKCSEEFLAPSSKTVKIYLLQAWQNFTGKLLYLRQTLSLLTNKMNEWI